MGAGGDMGMPAGASRVYVLESRPHDQPGIRVYTQTCRANYGQ